ncbi:hypothetical protein PHK61_00970 [Actinomycetospora lutea]|uniref:nSTAND1 domain-containing NTPase n=1 Tax=Actinomycetospora lutea TaxID=663604 RepID=UPI002365FCFF|nr:HEAT repeat domain-containing protein [Actinomycetospora lutea]MDD7936982.1 hypothetical protein [Actinomycetospora lutea]
MIAYRHPKALHSALAASDPAWRLAGGFYTREPANTKYVLSAGEAGDTPTWEDAWLRVEEQQPVLWETMSSYAARFPLLLLGVDPGSGALQDLVARLRPHRYFKPSGWIVADRVGEEVAHQWQDLGLTIISMTDEAFLRTCTEELNVRSHSVREWMPDVTDQIAAQPFKLLDYYDIEDASIFYARGEETRSLVRMVTSNRLVIVTGPSGAGKTSLLNAGLIAHINHLHPYRGLYVRLVEDPIAELLDAFERELGITCQRPSNTLQRREMWSVVDGTDSLPVVVFDQAEELFTRFENTMRDDLFALMIEAIAFPRSRVRFVVGIREDYLANLADFARQLPGILQNSFYVGALAKEQALEAIRRPFEAFGVHLDADLEAKIAADIGTVRVASPQLQIVCHRLFSSRESDSVGVEDYRRLGETKGILRDFLNNELEKLGTDRAAVVELLKSLVTSEGTKDVLSLEELSERSALPYTLSEKLAGYLTTNARLLRPVSSRSGVRYELAHEYLTHEIWLWMSPAEISRREAQELISADLRAWTTFDSLRLGIDRLERYEKHAQNIKVDEDVGTLLLLSCVRYSRPHGVWVEAIRRLPQPAQMRISWSLLRFIASRPDNQRFEAAEAIASLGSSVIISALSAADRDIRRAALYMVGGLGLSSARPVLIEMLEKAEDERSEELACFALGEIGGKGVVQALIPRTSGRSVQVAAAAVRGLGACREAQAYPYLMAALWGTQPAMTRAAQLGVAAAASVELSIYLAANIETIADVNGHPVTIDSARRLSLILEGLDHARIGGDELLAPFASLIRAKPLEMKRYSCAWLVEGLRRISGGGMPAERPDRQRVKQKLLSADQVVAALERYRPDSVAHALARGGPRSLPILRGLSSHESDKVRLTVLMALWLYDESRIGATWRTHIRPSILVRGLQDDSPAVRYYACLAVKNLRLIECVPFLRSLARDDARGSWYVIDVGKRVSDAAHAALDALRPESRVWRRDWQLDARPL